MIGIYGTDYQCSKMSLSVANIITDPTNHIRTFNMMFKKFC